MAGDRRSDTGGIGAAVLEDSVSESPVKYALGKKCFMPSRRVTATDADPFIFPCQDGKPGRGLFS